MASFTVTNLLDFGTGSLRQAILDANGLGGADNILFDPGLSGGTINLTSGELLITDDLTISGLGADFLSVDAGGFSRVFNIDDGDDDNFLDVLLEGLTITGGGVQALGEEGGGGIFNAENLAVSKSTISGNFSNNTGSISNSGELIVTNSTISGNLGIFDTGGISNSGKLTVTDSTISANSGYFGIAGISNSGDLTVTNSTISGNGGRIIGGIYNSGELTVTNSSISGNGSKNIAGISNLGQASVTNSTISNNYGEYGGSIGNLGELTVTNSTISGNGGLSSSFTNSGELTLTNSTISGNFSSFGGSITNSGELRLTNSTISGNAGLSSSVTNYSGGLATVSNTMIAGNMNYSSYDNTLGDVSGDFTSNGFNLIGDITGSTGFDNDLTFASLGGISIQDVIDTNLADNGGFTLTHALIPGSPAIDAGNNDDISALTDQRGAGFDRIVDGNNDTIAIVDIGAFEVQQQPTSVPESSSMLGLFGLVIVASGSILRRKLQQKL
ncbi:MAG: right-handed parallel beta-helix repeat-containing protein [Symploca sp. SIO2C1]|nr:right-handed parallel beta-helix repeat-containing protein [Symploca sp. SIO2C1]